MVKRYFYYQQANLANYKLLQEFAKKNRANPTEAERILWGLLKDKELGHFRRQYIIGDFIVDFICLASNLVVEVDGGYHSSSEQQILDEQRTEFLESLGMHVIRFSNEMIIGAPLEVLRIIKENIEKNNE